MNLTDFTKSKENYYWSKNDEGAIICGGDGGNGHFGLIKLTVNMDWIMWQLKQRAETVRELR